MVGLETPLNTGSRREILWEGGLIILANSDKRKARIT